MSATEGQPSPGSLSGDHSAEFLDRIDWPVHLAVLAYGVRVDVRTNDWHVAEGLARHLPPGWQPDDLSDAARTYSLLNEDDQSGAPRSSVYVNGMVLARRVPPQGALRILEAHLQLYVAEMAPDRVFVHAGVVGYRGRAIVLPGRSFAGKTTLVGELVRAGADYYSDEYAVLDAAAAVHPYPRLPSIREAGGRGAKKHKGEPFGERAGSVPLPVGLVVVSTFRPGAEWHPQSLSPGHAIQALFANTVAARRIPETVLTTLHGLVSVALVVSSERGEAASVVGPILDLVEEGVP